MISGEVPISGEEQAWYLLAGEIKEGEVRRIPSGERERDILITPFGAVANKVIMEGRLIFVEDVGKEGSGYLKVKVRDPSGDAVFYVDRYQGDLFDRVLSLPHGERIRVTTIVRSFVGSSKERVISLRGVELRAVEEGEEKLFTLMALKSLLERVNILRDGGVPPGVPEEVAEEVKALFRKVEWDRWNRILKVGLDWLLGEEGIAGEEEEEGAELTDNERMVFDLLKELGRGGEVRLDDLESYVRRRELSMENVMEAVRSLLEKGVIYEPVVGVYKII
ncbi:MAG: hypothetical protein DRN40_01425 [Thermoplasmata archaeon]|nr:MAG: hypothetical protein DRN40_01425 [Thermoplasmata archaeon]